MLPLGVNAIKFSDFKGGQKWVTFVKRDKQSLANPTEGGLYKNSKADKG